MSNLDKTGAQLIHSMRKTKAATALQTVQPPAATPYPDGSTVWPD